MSYQKKTIILIIVFTVFRLLFASALELNADESYYWTFASHLQWNYFDHPPMVAWLIRITTLNLHLNTELAVRSGAIISSAICTWLIFKIGEQVNNSLTGWYAAVMYTASIYCSLIAAAYIIPDSPQMVFWLGSIFILLKIFLKADKKISTNLLWCKFGLLCGLCIMCKVHGIFIWLGAILYILIFDRSWLKNRSLYVAALITLIVISPIIIWNIQHDFITYRFHSSRVSVAGAIVNLKQFAKLIVEIISINNPFNIFLIITSISLIAKGKMRDQQKTTRVLLLCSAPLIIFILVISVFRETFPHWSSPAFSTLFILPAIMLANKFEEKKKFLPTSLKWALAYTLFIGTITILTINYFPGTLSKNKEGMKFGADDTTLDTYGWRSAAAKFDSLYRSDVAKKIMPANASIIATNWAPASNIEFYFTPLTHQQVIGIGDFSNLHQYYFTNHYKKPLMPGDDAYYIISSNEFYYSGFNAVAGRFKTYSYPLVILQYRSQGLCKKVYVFRFKGYR